MGDFNNIKDLEKIMENLKRRKYILMYLNAFLKTQESAYEYNIALQHVLKENMLINDNDFRNFSYESYKYALFIHVLDIHYKIKIKF